MYQIYKLGLLYTVIDDTGELIKPSIQNLVSYLILVLIYSRGKCLSTNLRIAEIFRL